VNEKSDQNKPAAAADSKPVAAGESKPTSAGLPDGFTLTLDRTRAFAEVHGDQVEHNLGFIQDGIPFDRAGRLIRHLFEKKNARELEAKFPDAVQAMARKLKRLADEHRAAAVARVEDSANQLGEQQPHDHDPDADISLEAWASGELKLLPHVVYRVAKSRFGRFFRTYGEVVGHMVAAKMIDPARVKVT
jgi:hypothetical protein